MEKAERKPLTEKDVRSDMMHNLALRAAGHLGNFAGWCAFAAVWGYILSTLFKRCAQDGNAFALIIGIVFCVIFIYMLFALLYHICKFAVALAGLFAVRISGFHILEDTLVNSDSREYNALKAYAAFVRHRRPSLNGYEKVMYFQKYGRVVLGGGDLISTDYGDNFYLVAYGRKNKIVKAYNAKEYRK